MKTMTLDILGSKRLFDSLLLLFVFSNCQRLERALLDCRRRQVRLDKCVLLLHTCAHKYTHSRAQNIN